MGWMLGGFNTSGVSGHKAQHSLHKLKTIAHSVPGPMSHGFVVSVLYLYLQEMQRKRASRSPAPMMQNGNPWGRREQGSEITANPRVTSSPITFTTVSAPKERVRNIPGYSKRRNHLLQAQESKSACEFNINYRSRGRPLIMIVNYN